ncbi:MAG: transcription termination factor NusA [Kiritimatiellia bacterium]
MNNELQAVIEYMERERGLERETVIEAIESALLSAAKRSLGPTRELRVNINRKTYNIKVLASLTVVERKRSSLEISLTDALKAHPEAKLGDLVEAEITPENFGRIAAQTAKQAIMHKIKQAEKDKVYAEYKDRVGDIINCTVRRFERSDVVLDLGRGEGIMPSRERVPTEEYQAGDRIRAYLLSVQNLANGPEVILSRNSPEFVRRLFEIEVSEIADGTVQIKGIARESGFRSKVAVFSADQKVDPVGACVGMRGIRVKNIVRELNGEKVDIIPFSTDIKTYVTNALSPAKLAALEVDEAARSVRVAVDEDQLSLAIGKKGQNARLTAKLTGWKVDIRRNAPEVSFEDKVVHAVAELAGVPGIGETYAERLVRNGFLGLEGILAAETGDLVEAVEDLTNEEAKAIKLAAEQHFEKSQGRLE